MRRLVVIVVLACACRPAPSPPVRAGDPPSTRQIAATDHPVGITSRVYDDTSSGRRLAVTVWYPAEPGVHEEVIYWDGIFPGRGAWDAPMRAAPARFPLVMLSHGSGGDGANLAWLAEALAGQGWIAVAVDHPGDRFGDASSEGRFAVWRRPPDISNALTAVLADHTLGRRVDPARLAAAGHSSGGTTVLMLAGARLRPADFLARCMTPAAGPDCGLIAGLDVAAIPDLAQAGVSYRDRRIRAVVALAPVLGLAATSASLRAISVPVEIVASPADELVPFQQNAARYARSIPRARLTTIPDTGHFVFMPVCTRAGRLVAASVCVDGSLAPDREAVHAQTGELTTAFLGRALGVRASRPPP